MKPTISIRCSRGLGLLAVAAALSACAGSQAFKEGNALMAAGNYEAGLAKLEQASRAEPGNTEYRTTLLNRRLALVSSATSQALAAEREGNFAEAERLYRRTLSVEADNVAARQGLEALAHARRYRQTVVEAEALAKDGSDAGLAAAQDLLRPVLAQMPKMAEAANLKARLDEAQAKRKSEGKLAQAYRKRITLEFRDAPVRSVFDFISKVSGLNFFFDKDVRADMKTTILSKDTSVEDALKMLMSTSELEHNVMNENSILVYPNTPQKLKDYKPLYVRTFFLANGDVKTISYTIKALLKARDLVTDERLGLIIMRDTKEMIAMAERIINVQDIADPEVMLEVEVLEVNRDRVLQLGVDWPSKVRFAPGNSDGSTALTSISLAALRGLGAGQVNVSTDPNGIVAKAHSSDSDTNLLANPRIRVRNKEKAKVMIGERLPVITTTSNQTVTSTSVSYQEVGIKLDVEPTIYLDDEVAIKVTLDVSSVVGAEPLKDGGLVYTIGTRNATTVLRLRDGETQVLAGLIRDSDRRVASKVPGLGELPVLNRLFGSTNDRQERTEVVLAITPRVLRSVRRPDLLTAEFNSGTESNVGSGPSMISSGMDSSRQPGVAQPLPAGPAGGHDPTAPAAVGNAKNPPTPMTGGDSDEEEEEDGPPAKPGSPPGKPEPGAPVPPAPRKR